ncbi:hypothetical protein [Haliscomenobacter hydrossis]|uniref:Uncharacterized protein n=1 Tax=Haliscomenobacter hydrossis (strain ATCC 27775 / DSM 1100 / LMG 10767 / O) TaxID=760192 RepID=F4KSJ2_HALH1|nr:hypothetical protein [Haliscomenobacter hydrossis]AEE54343.1 hypothetical protein Halhy_6527 [Haliscomenobacter hydrossis DSM 1100]
MVRVFLLSIYLASIQGYCFSQNDLGKITTFDLKDTILEVKTKHNFHCVFPRKIGLEIKLLHEQKKTRLKIVFENHSSSAIWLSENNDQVENGDLISFYFAPDLSLLSPLYFRKIQPDQRVIYDLNYSKGVKQFELAVAFIGNFELLKKSLIESLQKVSGGNDLFYAPMSTIPSDGLLLFNLKNFSLSGKGRSKIQIINLTSN